MPSDPSFLQYERDRLAEGKPVCTWKGCTEPATMPQFSVNGTQWAHLCEAHDTELEEACGPNGTVRAMLRTWALAHGGAENMI